MICSLALGCSYCVGASELEDVSRAPAASKTRGYPGGTDEEDLRVQPQLVVPVRRLDAKGIQAQVLKTNGRSEVIEDAPSAPSSND